MKRTTILGLAAGMLVAGAANAGNELIMVAEKSAGPIFSADAMLDGQAVGLQFRVRINGASEKTQINLDNCLKAIPKTHQGGCGVSPDKQVVTGLVFSMTNAPLPKGLMPLGTVSVKSGEQVSFEVVEFLVAGDAGKPLDAQVRDGALK
jgi:hypothetical protein